MSAPTMAAPLLLLVDDVPEIAVMVRWLAKRAGHDLVAHADVAAAWRFLQDAEGREGESQYSVLSTQYSVLDAQPLPRRPDLVLLDLNLPGASGLELCRRLRAAPALADLPVALFTQADRPEDVAAGLDAGADFVVWKDLLARPEAWHQRLGEILEHSHGRPASVSLSSLQTAVLSLPPGEVVGALNQALRQSPVRQLGPAVVRALARRALTRVRQAGVAVPPPETETGLDDRLVTAGPGLNADRLVATWPREAVVVLVAALAEQMWHVLGPTAAASFRTALADSLPQLAGFLGP